MKLEALHDKAIGLLVNGKHMTEVAADLHVSPRTISRWVADPEFSTQLETERQAMRTLAATELQAATREQSTFIEEAYKRLNALIKSSDIKESTLLRLLALAMRCAQFEKVQEWKEFVYFERIKSNKAGTAEVARRVEQMRSSDKLLNAFSKLGLNPSSAGLSARTTSVEDQDGETPPKQDKTGHDGGGRGSGIGGRNEDGGGRESGACPEPVEGARPEPVERVGGRETNVENTGQNRTSPECAMIAHISSG